METWAIVVAGGSGTRFGSPKQFASLGSKSVLQWSVDSAAAACGHVVLVLPKEHVGGVTQGNAAVVVAGGSSRSESVRAGLASVPKTADAVLVHDAARPLASLAIWQRVLAELESGADCAIPVIPVVDTIKQVDEDGSLQTLQRDRLVVVQTPQGFKADVLREAHRSGGEATDDSALVEALGFKVITVPGDRSNIKITDPSDLMIAEVLADRSWR